MAPYFFVGSPDVRSFGSAFVPPLPLSGAIFCSSSLFVVRSCLPLCAPLAWSGVRPVAVDPRRDGPDPGHVQRGQRWDIFPRALPGRVAHAGSPRRRRRGRRERRVRTAAPPPWRPGRRRRPGEAPARRSRSVRRRSRGGGGCYRGQPRGLLPREAEGRAGAAAVDRDVGGARGRDRVQRASGAGHPDKERRAGGVGRGGGGGGGGGPRAGGNGGG